MADFSKMTLVQGLEEILTQPEFPEGRGIVVTLESLIAANQVKREGKVLTLINERSSSEKNSQTAVDSSTEPDTVALQRVLSENEEINQLTRALEARLLAMPDVAKSEISALLKQLNQGESLVSAPGSERGSQSQLSAEILSLAQELQRILAQGDNQLSQHIQAIIQNGEIPALVESAEEQAQALTAEEEDLVNRMRALPNRYHNILSQLLNNWERQVNGK